jgi:hypothetical protein
MCSLVYIGTFPFQVTCPFVIEPTHKFCFFFPLNISKPHLQKGPLPFPGHALPWMTPSFLVFGAWGFFTSVHFPTTWISIWCKSSLVCIRHMFISSTPLGMHPRCGFLALPWYETKSARVLELPLPLSMSVESSDSCSP